jgi:hypothetical protein
VCRFTRCSNAHSLIRSRGNGPITVMSSPSLFGRLGNGLVAGAVINPLTAVSGLPAGGKLNPFTSFGAPTQHGHLINLWDVNVLGTHEDYCTEGGLKN